MIRETLSHIAHRWRTQLPKTAAEKRSARPARSNASLTDVSVIYRELGGITVVSRMTGVLIGTLSAWGNRNRVPANQVLNFEAATGVSRHRLRADVFGPAKAS